MILFCIFLKWTPTPRYAFFCCMLVLIKYFLMAHRLILSAVQLIFLRQFVAFRRFSRAPGSFLFLLFWHRPLLKWAILGGTNFRPPLTVACVKAELPRVWRHKIRRNSQNWHVWPILTQRWILVASKKVQKSALFFLRKCANKEKMHIKLAFWGQNEGSQ